MIDFIIVGGGLAGIHFAKQCLLNDKSFILIDSNKNNASKVAAGVYNPVILKRYTLSWGADDQLSILDEVYQKISDYTNLTIDFKIPLRRRLFNIEEQNNWYLASEKPFLQKHLKTPISHVKYNGIKSEYGFGEVNNTGFVNTKTLIEAFINQLSFENKYRKETFIYSALEINQNSVSYQKIKAKHIVFAEGYNIHQNPYFNVLPIVGSKGEILIIKIPNLNLDFILKGNVFILPLGNDFYKVGSTYTWDDLTEEPTQEGFDYLFNEVKNLISIPFTVVKHEAGIRPASRDRKPIIGTHPQFNNLHVINGLGTRGVMIAPSMALQLFQNIINQKPLDPEADLKRFKKIIW